MTRLMTVAALLAAAIFGVWTASTASADPPGESEEITVNCGEGDFSVTARGGGKFGAARIDATGETFVVTSFSDVHGTFTDNEGNVQEFHDPDVSHPAPPNREILECHFIVVFENRFGTGEVDGDVTGFLAGRPD